jgi:2-polyprenyl-6-methoxyphenol hydroxylase-like FAD-dependent oxidoreductase
MFQTDVIVVGGGPVGLMAACELALLGVGVTVIERRTERVRQSRAFTIHTRTIETLALRGFLEECLTLGIPVPTGHYGMLETRLDFSAVDSSYPYSMFLPQEKLEGILEERAIALGVDVRRGYYVEELDQEAEFVRVIGRDGENRFEFHAEYVLGTDGARSLVRKSCGIEFPGNESNATFYFGDVVLNKPLAPGAFGSRNARGGVYAVPIGSGLHRVIFLDPSREHIPASEQVTLEELLEGAERILGTDLGICNPVWLSRVGDETRLATAYRRGRIFLAGDAAHIHMPAGGQGLNVGLQDAINLGWKLAGVIRQLAPDTLLDSYEDERMPVAASLAANTRAQTLLLNSFGEDGVAMREVMNQLLRIPAANLKIAKEISALSVSYEQPLFRDLEAHPDWTGNRLTDLDLELASAARTTLYSLLQQGNWVDLVLDTGSAHKLPRQLSSQWVRRIEATIHNSGSRFDSLGSILIRPDGYIAGVSTRT